MTYKCVSSLSINSIEMRKVYLLLIFLAPLFRMCVLKHKVQPFVMSQQALIFSQVSDNNPSQVLSLPSEAAL